MTDSYLIYKISLNSKVYIGYTGNLLVRIKQHIHRAVDENSQYFLYRAMRKYGIENMKYSIIEQNLSKSDAIEREKHYISEFKSFNSDFGYNMTIGGDGGQTWAHNSEQYRKKRSEVMTGERNSTYSGFSDDQIIDNAVLYFQENGHIFSKKWLREYSPTIGLPSSYSKFRFNGEGIVGFYIQFLKRCKAENISIELSQILNHSHSSLTARAKYNKLYHDHYKTT